MQSASFLNKKNNVGLTLSKLTLIATYPIKSDMETKLTRPTVALEK